MTNCPYCGRPIKGDKELPKMTVREFKIYTLLINNGVNYTTLKELALALGREDSNVSTIRVAISYLNRKLKSVGMTITNHNSIGYRIEEL